MRWSARLTCAAVVVSTTLAGCSGLPSADAPQGPDLAETAAAEAALPGWAVRDWWAFSTTLGDATYVVAADDGLAWRMETTDPATAYRDARTDVSRLGPQRKADLAGSQHGDFVKYFEFPLRDNATWSTRWDGVPVDVVARAVDGGRFEMRARNATHDMYRYTYDPDVGWFREFNFLATDGTPQFTMSLTGSGHNFTGEVVRWQLQQVYAATGANFQGAQSFEVAPGTTDLFLDYAFDCGGQGGYAIALQPVNPPGAGFQKNGPCVPETKAEPAVSAPAAGTWAYAVDLGGQGGSSRLLILQRTLQSTPVP